MFDLQSFLSGLALGLAGKPLVLAREPVAYLYNGVRLPKLPEWDREKYPLCIITSGEKGFGFECFPSTKKGVLESGSPIFVGEIRFLLSDGVWVQTDDRLDGYTAIWANYDLMYWVVDDEYALYLAASEPVPVYE